MADLYLNTYQRAFLGFFLEGPPARAVWLNDRGRKVGVVTDWTKPAPEAVKVAVNRHSDGGYEAKGLKAKETTLNLRDLAALAPCWDRPLWSLNEVGRELVAAADPGPHLTVSGKVHPHLEMKFQRRVAAEGRTPSEVIADLVLRYVEGKL